MQIPPYSLGSRVKAYASRKSRGWMGQAGLKHPSPQPFANACESMGTRQSRNYL
jgi:hypothetical protein